jgi:hypothetical protein
MKDLEAPFVRMMLGTATKFSNVRQVSRRSGLGVRDCHSGK